MTTEDRVKALLRDHKGSPKKEIAEFINNEVDAAKDNLKDYIKWLILFSVILVGYIINGGE